MNINRSTKLNITTEPPLLGRCCYKPFLVKNINEIMRSFPWQARQPEWFKEYLLLIKTRRKNKYYIVKGLSFVGKFKVNGFDKFKVIGWRDA